VTGANSRWGRVALAALAGQHNLRAVDVAFDAPLPAGVHARTGDLRAQPFVDAVLAGAEVVLHFAPLAQAFAQAQDNVDAAARGTFQLLEAAAKSGVRKVVLGSSLHLFDSVPATYRVRESWRPRPQPRVSDVCVYIAELLAKERVRIGTLQVEALRVGAVGNDEFAAAMAQALQPNSDAHNWHVMHVGQRPPAKIMASDTALRPRPIKKVLLLGAGGPIASATAQVMKANFALRLSDIKPLAEVVATAKPQSPGAPLPALLGPPHDEVVADVTQYDDVVNACAGVDALVNLTVIRHDPVETWRVNVLGAWNVMNAALAHGLWRVVHTGPWQIGRTDGAGYHWDWYVVDDVPSRPGAYLDMYLSSKFIGQEIVRIFAEHYGFSVPALLFCGFMNPETWEPTQDLIPFMSSWMDTARAIQAAVQVPALPSPYEVLHINSDLPHGIFTNAKAKRLLGWRPQDDLRKFFTYT
jgi:nucleoside-diphosphate-sugar epimerase